METFRWLEPWWSTESHDEHSHEAFRKQLELEVSPGHCTYGLPVRLIARGHGDDALFRILDGSGRVAEVHLTWGKGQDQLPWPIATVYSSMDEWVKLSMIPEHNSFFGEE
jgi:hypothetical protein